MEARFKERRGREIPFSRGSILFGDARAASLEVIMPSGEIFVFEILLAVGFLFWWGAIPALEWAFGIEKGGK